MKMKRLSVSPLQDRNEAKTNGNSILETKLPSLHCLIQYRKEKARQVDEQANVEKKEP